MTRFLCLTPRKDEIMQFLTNSEIFQGNMKNQTKKKPQLTFKQQAYTYCNK